MLSRLASVELWPRRQLPLRRMMSVVTQPRGTMWCRRTHPQWGKSWLAKNDAPARARESIRTAPLLHAADLVPNERAVCLLEQQAPDDNGHRGDNHRVVEAGKNVAGRRAAP